MNKILKYLLMIGYLVGTTLQLHSQGYIVPNGVTYAGYFPPLVGYEIHVIQNPANGDYSGFSLNPVSANTFQFLPFVDESVRTFLLAFNDPVSLQPILSQSYTELTYPNTYIFNSGIPFYVGFYTGYSPVNGVYNNPVFGWAQLVNNNGTIELLGSALEYGGGGIIAGTQTILPVPEPSALSLAALGGLLFGFRVRRASVQ